AKQAGKITFGTSLGDAGAGAGGGPNDAVVKCASTAGLLTVPRQKTGYLTTYEADGSGGQQMNAFITDQLGKQIPKCTLAGHFFHTFAPHLNGKLGFPHVPLSTCEEITFISN
ncbi:unnamed protein product, partial [Protopolystoma xenopodis]